MNNLPPALVLFFFVANIAAASAVAFTLLYHFVGQTDTFLKLLRVEQEKSEDLHRQPHGIAWRARPDSDHA